jgi:hypothetical protein
MSTEEFVAPRGAVPADYINLKIGIPERSSQVMEEVEYPRIVLMNFAGAVVAEIMVQPSMCIRIITCGIAVNDVQVLSRMCVNQTEAERTVRNARKFLLALSRQDAANEEERGHNETAGSSCQPGQKRAPK